MPVRATCTLCFQSVADKTAVEALAWSEEHECPQRDERELIAESKARHPANQEPLD